MNQIFLLKRWINERIVAKRLVHHQFGGNKTVDNHEITVNMEHDCPFVVHDGKCFGLRMDSSCRRKLAIPIHISSVGKRSQFA